MSILHLFGQMEELLVREISDMSKGDLPDIDWNASRGILKPADYIDMWRISVWDKTFLPFFSPNADPPFLKSKVLKDFPNGLMAFRRVLYKYLSHTIAP